MKMVREHILEPRRDSPGSCFYCEKETLNFCVSCGHYVCPTGACDLQHRKQFSLGMQDQ